MTPANERKAKERKAKQAAGLVRVEVWVPRENAADVRDIIRQLTELEAEVRSVTGISDAMLGSHPK